MDASYSWFDADDISSKLEELESVYHQVWNSKKIYQNSYRSG